MSGNRAAPRTTRGRKRKAPAMQDPVENLDSTENGCGLLPEKRRARGSGVALQQTSSTQNRHAALNTETTTGMLQTPMKPHASFVKGESSSEASGFSSVEASTPNPQHQPLAFVKPEVDQVMDVMMVKDEAPQTQAAPELAALPPADQECYRIFHYDLPRRLRHEFILNNEQVDLERMEPFKHTDAVFGNWTSHKIIQFFATILPAELMDIYKLFKFPSQLIEHLNSRELYINNQECQVFWYELIGMTDEMYDGVLESLWKLKYGCEDGYQRWKGKEHLAENMDIGREEVVSYERKEEGKEENREPGSNEEVEEEKYKDQWVAVPVADLEEENEKVEKQIAEEEEEFDLEPMLHQNSEEAPKYDVVPNGGQPAPELKMEQEEHRRILHAHAQEDFLLAPAPTMPTTDQVPLQAGEQQGNKVPAPALPVAHPADLAQAPPQVRPPLDAFRLDAERLSELLRLGFLAPPPPADQNRIEVQAPLQIVEQQVLAPAIPDAPPIVRAPLLGGWQQGLGVPAPAIPDVPPVALAPLQGGWQQAPGYWAPLPQAAPPATPAIPDAWIPRQEGAYGRMPMLCMAMQDLRRAQFQAALQQREQQFPGINAPPPAAAPPIAQHVRGLPQGVQHLRPGIFSPPLQAPAPIDQHLGVQAAHWRRQEQIPGFPAPPPAAVPPMSPFAQAPPLYHPPNHLILVPRDGQLYVPPPYRPLQ